MKNDDGECSWVEPPCYSKAAWGTSLCKAHVMTVERIAWEHHGDTQRFRAQQAARQVALDEQAQVYYVRLSADVIKIGTTTVMTQRLSGLRVKADRVLATEPGGYDLEKIRHQQFAHLRHGRIEDFTPAEDLLSHIAMLVEHYGPPKITGYPKIATQPIERPYAGPPS